MSETIYIFWNGWNVEYYEFYSLAFAIPTILSICRSSLNLSSTVPFTPSAALLSRSVAVTPQHSITSGKIRASFDRHGLLKVVHENVCPWSKLAERNSPKWCARPPNPIPLGMLSELKFTAHYDEWRSYDLISCEHSWFAKISFFWFWMLTHCRLWFAPVGRKSDAFG